MSSLLAICFTTSAVTTEKCSAFVMSFPRVDREMQIIAECDNTIYGIIASGECGDKMKVSDKGRRN